MRIKLEELTLIGSEIQKIVEDTGTDYMDACLLYCERKGMEIETLGAILKKHQKITGQLQREGEALNFLPKSNTETLVFEDE